METDEEIVEQLYLVVQPEGDASPDINIWLVNETEEDIEYRVRTGEFTTLDDGVLESSIAERAARIIPARSAVVFEHEDIWGLDFVVWWRIDVVGRDGVVHPMMATRGKYGWTNRDMYVPIPFTDKSGIVIRMRPVHRPNNSSISAGSMSPHGPRGAVRSATSAAAQGTAVGSRLMSHRIPSYHRRPPVCGCVIALSPWHGLTIADSCSRPLSLADS